MLTKLSIRSINLAHISLTFIGFMWVLPFLNYHHAYPITTFYQEWGAAILGLCAMPLLVTKRYWQQAEIPRIVLLPIGMMLLLLVQYLLDKVPSFEQTLLLTMYFIGAALLIMLGHRLREELGLPLLALVLATFLVLGAELNALVGIIQHYQWRSFLDSVVAVKTSTAVFGNTGQPNHFANYIALGLASIGLLHTRWSLRIWLTVLLVAPLLFVLVLSGSRSAWLYLLLMVGMSYLWQRRDQSYLPLMKYALWLLLGFILMQFIVQIPWLAGSSGKISTLDRIVGNAAGGSIRMHIWKESWLIFTKFPLLGAGFEQFAWQHLQLGAELQNSRITGMYNNAHNLVMQLAAETGLAGLSILFGTLGLWFWQAWHDDRTIFHWWGYFVLAVFGIHSLLEYPLWYGHFIGIAAVALGMLGGRVYRLKLHNIGRLSVSVLLLLGIYSLAQLFQGYQKLETTLAQHPLSNNDASYYSRLRDGLLGVYEYKLLRPHAELYLSDMIVPDTTHLADKLVLNEHASRFFPAAPVIYRQVGLLAMSDRLPEAKILLQNALWAYPSDFQATQIWLNQWALKDPARFSALSEFATQKYEEYQRIVSVK